jgi:AcrR family transcriptional regulator
MDSKRRPRRSKNTARAEAGKNGSRLRLLEAAERLFAEHGYNGVSIRDIAAAARANISSVYYHFDSKPKLLEAVCERRLKPAAMARAAAMANGAKGRRAADDLIAGFVGPPLRAALGRTRDAEAYRRLAGHLATDPTPAVRRAIRAIYDESVRDFIRRLALVYGGKGEAFFWAVACAIGAAVYVQGDIAHLGKMLGGGRGENAEVGLRHVTRFIHGGLEAAARG